MSDDNSPQRGDNDAREQVPSRNDHGQSEEGFRKRRSIRLMPETTDDSAFAGPEKPTDLESSVFTLTQSNTGAVESSAARDVQTAQRPPQDTEYRASARGEL
jgi:hypothetical protein